MTTSSSSRSRRWSTSAGCGARRLDGQGAGRARRRDGVCEARQADARGRLRALPRAGPDERNLGERFMTTTIDVPVNTMIADLDTGLRDLLIGQLKRHGFDDIDLVFATPTREWGST